MWDNYIPWGFQVAQWLKNPPRQCRRCGFDPWIRKISWRRKWQLTPVFLPGESHGQRSQGDYSPGDCKESNRSKWLEQQYSRMRNVLELAYTSSQGGSLCISFQSHVQRHHASSLKSASHGGETYPRKSAVLQISSSLKLLAFTSTLLNRFNEKRRRFKRLY